VGDGYEVLVVHRPRYDDWSLPKGKDEPGETPEEAAVREVMEETGQPARIIAPLGESSYPTIAGDKVVRWFAMRATAPSAFVPNGEVDQIRWLEPKAAAKVLSYHRDREIVTSLDGRALLGTGTLFLVRHGAAGDRSSWKGDDRDRPLTKKGEEQAQALIRQFAGEGIERVISSPYVRCTQTVQPLAHHLRIPLELDDSLEEGAGKAARDLVKSLVGSNAVLCSHGDVIPSLLDWMARRDMRLLSATDCKKGSTWEVEVRAGAFDSARYLPPPSI